MPQDLSLRKNASTIIFQDEEKFLLVKKPRKNHAWQLPQGGVDEGEKMADCAKREVKEEVGLALDKVFPITCKYTYEWPEEHKRRTNYCGQELCFFAAEMPKNQEIVFNDDPYEPKEAKIVSLPEALELVEGGEYKDTLKRVFEEGRRLVFK